MEDRIHKIEKDLAIMSLTQKTMGESLQKIAVTLERIASTHTEIRILQEKVNYMDKEVGESFKRVHKRQDDTDGILRKIMWLVVTPIILALIGTYVMGGIK